MVKVSWSLSQQAGAAAFKLFERTPLSPALTAKDLSGGRTPIFNVPHWQRSNHNPVETDEDNTPQTISDSNHWPHCNYDLNNPNDSEDNCTTDNESVIEQNNCIENLE
jgi:hypothetical protein